MTVFRDVRFGVGLALLSACSPTPPRDSGNVADAPAPVLTATPAPSAPVAPTVDYAGRWTGVEGMFLDVAPGATPGAYRLTMQYDLDHKGSFDAMRDGDTLAFERDGKRMALKPTDGAATGLKYLAGKKDCLTVASGEGYCRD